MSTAALRTTAALDAAGARELTDRIRESVESLWSLLLEAYERQAWRALGYDRWQDYVETEFDMTRRRAYQLLDQGRVIRELAAASGGDVNHGTHVTEREARDIKPALPQVAAEIRTRVESGVEPAAAVRSVVEEARRQRERSFGKDYTAAFPVSTTSEETDMPAVAPRPGSGAKLKTPAGKTVEDVVREGVSLESDGASAAEAAEMVGLAVQTYRMGRYVVALADRTDLSERNAATAAAALTAMNAGAVVAPVFASIEDMVDRIYGVGSQRTGTMERMESFQRAKFDRAFGALTQVCSAVEHIEAPHLSPEDTRRFSDELKAAARHVETFRRRIEEANR